MKRYMTAMVMVIVVTCCCGSLVAGEPEGRKIQAAAREFDEGRRAFQLEDFASAAAHFENAYRDAPTPEALRLAIRAHDRAGNSARAATLAALARETYPEDTATNTLAQEYLKRLEPNLHRVSIRCEPACAIVVDQRAIIDEPAPTMVFYLPPGSHMLAAIWSEGREKSERIEGLAGGRSSLSLRAPDIIPSASSTSEPSNPLSTQDPLLDTRTRSGLPPVITYVGAGVTVLLTGATIWSGIDTKKNPGRDVVQDRCLDLGENCPEYRQALDSQRRTNLLIGTTAGVAVLTGVAALFTDWGGDKGETSFVHPAMFGSAPGLLATGEF